MTHQSRLTRRGFSAGALLGLSLALAAAIGPASAEKVGVAAAVNPDAFSSLAGAPKSQLNIGKSIFFNERIATTTSGLVQVLLVDGSTFTVGPDSDLVIDKFIYDPNKGTGQIAASFSKGVMRFVGGKISKSDNAVTIKTPAGAMAVRGCIVLTQVTQSNFAAVLVYGDYLKMKNFVVYEPGNGVFISATGNAEVRKATSADIGGMTAALSNNQGNNQGNNGDTGKSSNPGTVIQLVDTANLAELIQNANTQVVVDSAKVEVTPPVVEVTPPVVEVTPPVVEVTPPVVEVRPDVVVPPPCVGAECNLPPQEANLQGYAAGTFTQPPGSTDDSPAGTLLSASPNTVSFTGDPQVFAGAEFTLFAEDGGGAKIRFSPAPLTPSPTTTAVTQSSTTTLPPYALLFAGVADHTAIEVYDETNNTTDPPTLFDPATVNSSSNAAFVGVNGATDVLCVDCEFLKWGLWQATLRFKTTPTASGETSVDTLGFWVAGDIVTDTVGALPTGGGADYYGKALGTVSTDLFGQQFQTSPAQGDMHMGWDFKSRTGTFNVTGFDKRPGLVDGLNFGGNLAMPGAPTGSPNKFSGTLTGSLPASLQLGEGSGLDGHVIGSFVKSGGQTAGDKPAGVMGNWAIGNDRYKAGGIFAGSQTQPPTQ